MRVDVGRLADWFSEFNRKYFDGKLPVPDFAVGMSRTRLGSLTWTVSRKVFRKSVCSYMLRISNYYDMEERYFKNVLLHEMIHLYIVSGGLKDTSPHGILFRRKMREINSDGWDISVSARMSGAPVARKETRKRTRLVLAVVMKSGKRLLSVVNPAYIVKIEAALRRSPDVAEHSWHLSDDGYFAGFPTVRTPKGRIVDNDFYDRMLAGMRPVDLPLPQVRQSKK